MGKSKRFGIPSNQFAYTNTAQSLIGLSPRESHMLVQLTKHVCTNGSAFPSHATLAGPSGYSRRTVRRALKDLEQRGLIRRAPRSRAFQGNSSSFYSVVLSTGQPSGQHVHAIGQHVRISQDTLAALIRPLNETKEEEGRLLVFAFEEYLLETLYDVIDLKPHPSLICVGSVSRWLFNGHTAAQFEPALVHVLDEARKLERDYLAEGRRLSKWSDLIDRLKDPTELGAPQVAPDELDPICEEIWELLPAHQQNHPRSRSLLASISVERDGLEIRFIANSQYALDYIRDTCRKALATLAQRHGYVFAFES